MSEWLSYQEAAAELGISVRTLQRRIDRGYLRSTKPGGGRPVITRRELEAHRRSPEHQRHHTAA